MKPGDFLERRLAVIRERIGSGDYVISFTHTEKWRERKIGAGDVEEARGSSCLILGLATGRPLHVVCGRLEPHRILIITAYEPDPAEWESDWRTRRR